MENQHKKIKGYRDLSQEEIDLMNEGKELAEQVGAWIEKLETQAIVGANTIAGMPDMNEAVELGLKLPDIRWVRIGQTHLQQGFMAAIRAIAKPTTF